MLTSEDTPEATELDAAQRQRLGDVVEKHMGILSIEPGHPLDLLANDQQAAADPAKEPRRKSRLPIGDRALDQDRLAAGRKDARVIPQNTNATCPVPAHRPANHSSQFWD